MTPEPIDDFIRSSLPSDDIPPERIDRVIGAVMTGLDDQRASRSCWAEWRRRVEVPAFRPLFGAYAVPMAMAAVLGVAVVRTFTPSGDAVQLSAFILSSSMTLAGF